MLKLAAPLASGVLAALVYLPALGGQPAPVRFPVILERHPVPHRGHHAALAEDIVPLGGTLIVFVHGGRPP